jgi:hypothetical protein
LRAAGHDYWALGHVHEPSVRSEHPWIVFPGNTQGRHARETGAKGAMVVTVEDGAVRSVEHRACDEARWARVEADVRGAADAGDAIAEVRRQLAEAARAADGRPLAARVALRAGGEVGRALQADAAWSEGEVRAAAASVAEDLWIERVRLHVDEDGSGGLPPELVQLLADALEDPDCARAVSAAAAPLLGKLPADVGDPDAAPLLTAARTGDAAALLRAARAAVAARLGGEAH